METNVKDLKPINKVGMDFSEFEGMRVRIESINVEHVKSQYSKKADGTVPVLKVVTETITEVMASDSNEKQKITASELFNLTEDAGELGWSTAPQSKLNNFLIKMKVSRPDELIGKFVIVKTRVVKGQFGDKTFLGFITS